jgi:hypothetical protein
VTGSVLANDSDIDGGTLGVTAVAGGTRARRWPEPTATAA